MLVIKNMITATIDLLEKYDVLILEFQKILLNQIQYKCQNKIFFNSMNNIQEL